LWFVRVPSWCSCLYLFSLKHRFETHDAVDKKIGQQITVNLWSVVVLSATVSSSETPMADTIKTGTTLIEEEVPMTESLLCESENYPTNCVSLPKDDPNVGTGLVDAPECGDAMKLQIRINPETRVIRAPKFETFGFGSAIASSSLAAEGVKGKTSRKRWPSRTRISSASFVSRATAPDAARYSRFWGRLHLAGSPIF
jgi:hypothetical protein